MFQSMDHPVARGRTRAATGLECKHFADHKRTSRETTRVEAPADRTTSNNLKRSDVRDYMSLYIQSTRQELSNPAVLVKFTHEAVSMLSNSGLGSFSIPVCSESSSPALIDCLFRLNTDRLRGQIEQDRTWVAGALSWCKLQRHIPRVRQC